MLAQAAELVVPIYAENRRLTLSKSRQQRSSCMIVKHKCFKRRTS